MDDPALTEALASSQRLGMLGDRPISDVIVHAGAFVDALAAVRGTVVDLGSGGGVPGLVIARARPDLSIVLVERRTTRADHLQRLVRRLGLGGRVAVHAADAGALPSSTLADAVVARSFGPPLATARAAAALLRPGGRLVVSEPPHVDGRWRGDEVRELGFVVLDQPDRRVACLMFHVEHQAY